MSITNISPSSNNINIANDNSITSPTTDPLIVPTFASWFSPEGISDIEKLAFPELAKTDDPFVNTYRQFRNYIVETYRARPGEYLSLTACRRNLAGDVAVISKIHSFLEQWGLVNYSQLTSLEAATNASTLNNKSGYFWQLPADHRLAHNCTLPDLSGLEVDCPTCQKPLGSGLVPFYALVDRNSGIPDVASIRCPECFSNGILPAGKSSIDYIKVDPNIWRQSSWSDNDTLKLLELVESQSSADNTPSNLDWDTIAEQMQKRKEQCIWYFLKLPFPVQVLQPQSYEESLTSKQNIDVNSLPFAFVRNPTMALLTFLASQVHPQVASAAAQAALKELSSKSDDQKQEILDNNTYLASVTLAVATVRAKQLADEERAKIAQLHDNIVALQLRKVQQKMAQLEAMARGVEEEKKAVEAQRVAVFYERYKLFSKMKELDSKNPTPPPLSSGSSSKMQQ